MAPVVVRTVQLINSFIYYLVARKFFPPSTLAGKIVLRNGVRSYRIDS